MLLSTQIRWKWLFDAISARNTTHAHARLDNCSWTTIPNAQLFTHPVWKYIFLILSGSGPQTRPRAHMELCEVLLRMATDPIYSRYRRICSTSCCWFWLLTRKRWFSLNNRDWWVLWVCKAIMREKRAFRIESSNVLFMFRLCFRIF